MSSSETGADPVGPHRRRLSPLMIVSSVIASASIAVLAATFIVGTDDSSTSVGTPNDTLVLGAVAPGQLQENQLAPNAVFLMIDGTQRTLSTFAGTPLIINFWGSTCVPCKQEMPAFEREHQRLGSAIAFLGVSVSDSPAAAAGFIRETGVTYPQALDGSAEQLAAFGGIALPHTVVIDADGIVRSIRNKALSENELRAITDDLAR